MLDLRAHDRCDRCGARAYHVAHKTGYTELMFCNHHHAEFKDSLLDNYWLIESDELADDPVPASAFTE